MTNMRKCKGGREIDGRCLKTFKSRSEIEEAGINNLEQYERKYMKGITNDYAKPQEWLNEFVRKHNLDYDDVRVSTFWVYPKNPPYRSGGFPFSILEHINEKIVKDFWFE